MSFSPQSSHSSASSSATTATASNGRHNNSHHNNHRNGSGHNTYSSGGGGGGGNDWSSQSSVGSSSSGSLSRPTLQSLASVSSGVSLKTDVINSHQFKDTVDHYERGLCECISNVESELNLNKSVDSWQSLGSTATTASPVPSDDSSYVLSVSHKDSLRHQLSHIRHMRDEYETHLRLRDALRKMMKISKSRECENEWKENSRILITFEKQLELMIGVFHLKVEEIEGWARICPRDQYEIEFRYGRQRHVVRVRIGKDGRREWSDQEFPLKASLLDSIVVRVREVKAGWTKRYVTLGITQMASKDMMRARTQLMSLMANSSGSLKLKVRTKWTPTVSTYFTNNNNNNNTNNNYANNCETINSVSSPLIMDGQLEGNDRRRGSASVSRMSSREGAVESLSQLMSALEDFQGQYEELSPMAAAVNRLWRIYAKESAALSVSSSSSSLAAPPPQPPLSPEFDGSDNEDIDAALAEFQFLEEDTDDINNSVISRESSPVSSAPPLPAPPISSQWEACVVTHTRDAIIQLSHCGQWVLKAREKDALHRLRDDALALQELAKNYGNPSDDYFGDAVDSRARELWQCLTAGGGGGPKQRPPIVMDWRTCADGINILMHSYESCDDIRGDASQWLTAKISECDYVTALHVRAFWSRFEPELTLQDVLKVALDVSRVIRAKEIPQFETLLSRFIAREWNPHEVTWAAVRAMITTSEPQMAAIARQWLKIMTDDNEPEILSHLLSGLESNSLTTRRASCHALAYIRAEQSIDELLFVSTEDTDPRVREEARKALSTFGGDAQQRWHQCSLTQMGFTGLSISSGSDHNNKNWAKLSSNSINNNNNNF